MADSFPHVQRRHKKDDDPKMIGLWKVGRTIGKGSSGALSFQRGRRRSPDVLNDLRKSQDRSTLKDREICGSQDRFEAADS